FEMARTRHFALAHSADEQIVLPLWEFVAGVERQPRRGDCGYPVHERRLHAVPVRIDAHARAEIEASVAEDRLAVVLSGPQLVHLVAAVWSVLDRPYGARDGIDRKPEDIAVPHRVDFRAIFGAADERIVRRHRAVVFQSQRLAGETHRILRRLMFG